MSDFHNVFPAVTNQREVTIKGDIFPSTKIPGLVLAKSTKSMKISRDDFYGVNMTLLSFFQNQRKNQKQKTGGPPQHADILQ